MVSVYQGFKNKSAGDDINYRGNTKDLIDKGLTAPEGSRTYENAVEAAEKFLDNEKAPSEEVAESIDAAGWQVEDINKDGLLLDAEYAIICSENAHDVCGEIVRGINRLVPGAFGYSAEEISEIKSIWQRAYNDPEGYSAELEAKKAESDRWNVPENGETVSERAETSIEKSLKKHMGIEEGEKTPHPPQAVPLPLEGKAQKSIDEVTAEMTAEHREMLKTKSKADFDALKGTEKLKAAGVTGITGSVGLYGHTEQAIEQKQGTRETQKAIREVERVLSPDEIKFAKLVNRGEIDAKYVPESLRRDLILDLAEMYKAQDGFKAAKKLINKSLSAFYLAYKCTCGNQFFLNK
ncbi:MAG: hypothetical protein Q4G23_05165 [Clostridia bacterium]|nr:hypothetical protein [Clostridia bacterium]